MTKTMKIKRSAFVTLGFLALMTLFPLFSSPHIGGSSLMAFAAEEPAVTTGEEGEEVAHEQEFYSIPYPELKKSDYPAPLGLDGRAVIWIVAQLHLYLGAFVLAVPIFVLIIEGIGVASKDKRYDKLAYEFIKISITGYSITAIMGGLLAFSFFVFYPDFFKYLSSVFGPVMIIYAALFFLESAALYIYYYGWHRMEEGFSKWVHLSLGMVLNVVGTTLMLLANSWATFMMSPTGVDDTGRVTGSVWLVIQNHLWNPLNLHRFIANLCFGGAVVGAYAAYMFLNAKSEEKRAHYDWMGYTSSLVAISALLPLPFAGYFLMAEVYAYSQQMGITAMGGILAWIFIIQAVLIGSLFISANYYLWCGMGRLEGSERYTPYLKYIGAAVAISFLMWLTPHSIVLKASEMKAIGGAFHPLLGPFGIMPAKNMAVNILIQSTFLSFVLYRRAGKIATVPWAKYGNLFQIAIFTAAIINVIGAGLYGYMVPTTFKVGSSIPQVLSTLSVLIFVTIIDSFMFKGAKEIGPVRWGKVPARSQYALILLAVSFAWLMGLMGYVRSSLRQNWHVYGLFKDNAASNFFLTTGGAMNMVSIAVIIFMLFMVFIFWIGQLGAKPEKEMVEKKKEVLGKVATEEV